MEDLFVVLLSWAVTLSGYSKPDELPQVVFVPHEFFVQNACNGKECRVYGWYRSGREVYLLEEIDYFETFPASAVVHEMTHYLQCSSGKQCVGRDGLAASDGAVVGCGKIIDLEREAYKVQRDFLLRYGIYRPVGMAMTHVGCDEEHLPP